MTATRLQLTDNLWVTQSAFEATNSGIFLAGRDACLIDPGVFPAEIEAIRKALDGRDASPRLIILTHSHWDHILGPERFPGVKTIAHAEYLTEVRGENGAHIQRQIAAWEAENDVQPAAPRPFQIPIPDRLFSDSIDVSVGESEKLRLIHVPGHAADQLAAYHAPTSLLWASDILSDLEIPFVSHSLSSFERTLSMLSQWEIRILVPGHGNPTSSRDEIRGRFAHDRAYLEGLKERVATAVERGLSVEETVLRCEDMKFRRPAENRAPHKLNVESVYLELGGEADPAAVGWR